MRIMTMRRCLATLLAVLALAVFGCGMRSMDGEYVFVEGGLQRDYPASLQRTADVVQQTAQEHGLRVERMDMTPEYADVMLVNGEVPLWIIMDAAGAERTAVLARSGLGGDAAAALRAHEALRVQLDPLPVEE